MLQCSLSTSEIDVYILDLCTLLQYPGIIVSRLCAACWLVVLSPMSSNIARAGSLQGILFEHFWDLEI